VWLWTLCPNVHLGGVLGRWCLDLLLNCCRMGCGITCIRCAFGLNEQQVGFLVATRAVLDALRYDEQAEGSSDLVKGTAERATDCAKQILTALEVPSALERAALETKAVVALPPQSPRRGVSVTLGSSRSKPPLAGVDELKHIGQGDHPSSLGSERLGSG
jgi:hypothetical protein